MQMPVALQTMIGYCQPGSSLGYFDGGRHPLHALDPDARALDWAAPISVQEDGPGEVTAGEYEHLTPAGTPVCFCDLFACV